MNRQDDSYIRIFVYLVSFHQKKKFYFVRSSESRSNEVKLALCFIHRQTYVVKVIFRPYPRFPSFAIFLHSLFFFSFADRTSERSRLFLHCLPFFLEYFYLPRAKNKMGKMMQPASLESRSFSYPFEVMFVLHVNLNSQMNKISAAISSHVERPKMKGNEIFSGQIHDGTRIKVVTNKKKNGKCSKCMKNVKTRNSQLRTLPPDGARGAAALATAISRLCVEFQPDCFNYQANLNGLNELLYKYKHRKIASAKTTYIFNIISGICAYMYFIFVDCCTSNFESICH